MPGTWKGLKVAVKTLLLEDHSSGAQERRRAVKEAAIASAVGRGFPHVLCTYTHELRPVAQASAPSLREASVWRLYLVQEFCNCGDLHSLLRARVLPGLDAAFAPSLALAWQLAAGLAHLHSQAVLHRGLSSASVMCALRDPASAQSQSAADVGSDAYPPAWRRRIPDAVLGCELVLKLTDFGLSTVLTPDRSRASSFVAQGALLYRAPEVASGQAASASSDVFSLGALVLEVLHARPLQELLLLPPTTPHDPAGGSAAGEGDGSSGALGSVTAGASGAAAASGASQPRSCVLLGPPGAEVAVRLPASTPGSVCDLLLRCTHVDPSRRPHARDVLDELSRELFRLH